jgi:ankyrin repeat protein
MTQIAQIRKTVLKYSEKNSNLYESASNELTQTFYQNNSNSNSKHILNETNYDNDYILSNQLNDVVLSNSIELNYFVFHNDKESVLKYISKYKTKLQQKSNNNNKSQSKVTLGDYLSIRDVHGNTPLHIATMMGHSEIVNILLENGAVRKTKCFHLLKKYKTYNDSFVFEALA